VAGSPADKAGVKKGDRIIRIDGKAVSLTMFDGLARSLQPGDTVRLKVSANGREKDVTLIATERPAQYATPFEDIVIMRGDSAMKMARAFMDSARIRIEAPGRDSILLRRFGGNVSILRDKMLADSLLMGDIRIFRDSLPLGFKFEMIKPGDRPTFEMSVPHIEMITSRTGVAGAEFTELNAGLSQYFGTSKGLLVLRVGPGTPAAQAGLEAGDVLTRIDGRDVESIDQFRTAIFRNREASIKLDVIRKGKPQSLNMQLRLRRE
jgi:C-terminal processing protease CtpA/Prc